MIETGFIVFAGLALIMVKLPRRLMLRALKHDLAIDLVVTLLVFLIHYGTFSGIMAATVAGLLTSVATSGAKKLFGYIDHDIYYVGKYRLNVE
jgi:nucleoside permease NupC